MLKERFPNTQLFHLIYGIYSPISISLIQLQWKLTILPTLWFWNSPTAHWAGTAPTKSRCHVFMCFAPRRAPQACLPSKACLFFERQHDDIWKGQWGRWEPRNTVEPQVCQGHLLSFWPCLLPSLGLSLLRRVFCIRGWHASSVKGQVVNILVFVGRPTSVPALQPWCG